MTPVVVAALLICSQHVQGYSYGGSIGELINYERDPLNLLTSEVVFQFYPEYSEKCGKLITRVKDIRQAAAAREYEATERIRQMKAVAAAKKDQPALDAAIAAVFAK